MKRLSSLFQSSRLLMFILLCLVLFGVGFWSISTAQILKKPVRGSLLQQEIKTDAQTEKPRVFIKKQPDSPLQITIVKTENMNLNAPELILKITNIGDKPVLAYTIRYENSPKTSSAGGSDMSIAASSRSVLLPHNSKEAEIENGSDYSEPLRRIIVSVDFVEFTDGARWGPDRDKSAERLDGQRAGARAARDFLLTSLKLKGALVVMNSLEEMEIIPPPRVSQEYASGFRSGVNLIRSRLKHTYKNGGDAAIEANIRQPFDASEEARR